MGEEEVKLVYSRRSSTSRASVGADGGVDESFRVEIELKKGQKYAGIESREKNCLSRTFQKLWPTLKGIAINLTHGPVTRVLILTSS